MRFPEGPITSNSKSVTLGFAEQLAEERFLDAPPVARRDDLRERPALHVADDFLRRPVQPDDDPVAIDDVRRDVDVRESALEVRAKPLQEPRHSNASLRRIGSRVKSRAPSFCAR